MSYSAGEAVYRQDHEARSYSDELDTAAQSFVTETIGDSKVVVFGRQWCKSSRLVKRFFDALDVEYTAIDLDTAAFQQQGFGERVRQALTEQYQLDVLPLIFIGGEPMGGCDALFQEARRSVA